MPSRNVYVMGHSLGIADFGILGPFFESGSVGRITVFYHSQSAYEDLVINLVKALGKETAVGMISRGRIAFRELEGARIRYQ